MKAGSVQNSVNYNSRTFCGKPAKTETGAPYYKTNAGTIAGACMAVPAVGFWRGIASKLPLSKEELNETDKHLKAIGSVFKDKNSKNTFKNNVENMDPKLFEHNKFIKKYSIPIALTAGLCTLGCGVLVDRLRNKKAGETADLIKETGVKNALLNNDRIAISRNRNPYYDSNVGQKYGALLGAGCGILHSFMSNGKLNGVKNIISSAVTFALGGLLMGCIADKCSNNDAKKHA